MTSARSRKPAASQRGLRRLWTKPRTSAPARRSPARRGSSCGLDLRWPSTDAKPPREQQRRARRQTPRASRKAGAGHERPAACGPGDQQRRHDHDEPRAAGEPEHGVRVAEGGKPTRRDACADRGREPRGRCVEDRPAEAVAAVSTARRQTPCRSPCNARPAGTLARMGWPSAGSALVCGSWPWPAAARSAPAPGRLGALQRALEARLGITCSASPPRRAIRASRCCARRSPAAMGRAGHRAGVLRA